MEQVWYSQLGTGLVQPNWNRIGTTMTNFRVFPYQNPKRSYSNFGNSVMTPMMTPVYDDSQDEGYDSV